MIESSGKSFSITSKGKELMSSYKEFSEKYEQTFDALLSEIDPKKTVEEYLNTIYK